MGPLERHGYISLYIHNFTGTALPSRNPTKINAFIGRSSISGPSVSIGTIAELMNAILVTMVDIVESKTNPSKREPQGEAPKRDVKTLTCKLPSGYLT